VKSYTIKNGLLFAFPEAQISLLVCLVYMYILVSEKQTRIKNLRKCKWSFDSTL